MKQANVTDTVTTADATNDRVHSLEELQQQLHEAQEREKRALADYQNLVRRNQEERARLLKFANRELVGALLRPVSHLGMAAEELKDQGLNMVVQDFWRVLDETGLEEINPEGEKFDVQTMEVVDKTGKGDTVQKVVTKGYRLNGEVIQHAKVIVG